MLVRDARNGDINKVDGLYRDFCKELGTSTDTPPVIVVDKFVVCELFDDLIGYGTAKAVVYDGKGYSQGEHLYVRPEFRGTWAAGLMYKELCRWGKSQGKPFILLSAPEELEMWLRRGYKPIGYIMVKEIK